MRSVCFLDNITFLHTYRTIAPHRIIRTPSFYLNKVKIYRSEGGQNDNILHLLENSNKEWLLIKYKYNRLMWDG